MSFCAALLLPLAFCLPSSSGPTNSRPHSPRAASAPTPIAHQDAPAPPSDKELRRRWEALDPELQSEVCQWFSAEAEWLETFQLGLVRYVLAQEENDPGFWPERGERPFFDPKVEAPRQPIRRKPVEATSRSGQRALEKLGPPARRMTAAWDYDWAARTVVRTGDDRACELIFENALVGLPADLGLAEALLLKQLDGGEEQDAFIAFRHAYTDRGGNVFPLSLYDAWSSGQEIEMPDVDILGLHRALGGARDEFSAPIPNSAHNKLYGGLGDRLRAAKRYREVREAAARTYFSGQPVLPDGYGPNLDRFHALWEKHSSETAKLAEALPSARNWEPFLAAWAKECANGSECLASGTRRRYVLEQDAAALRALFVRILGQVDG